MHTETGKHAVVRFSPPVDYKNKRGCETERYVSDNCFIEGLKKTGIALDRKILSDLAISDAPGFSTICGQAKAALEA